MTLQRLRLRPLRRPHALALGAALALAASTTPAPARAAAPGHEPGAPERAGHAPAAARPFVIGDALGISPFRDWRTIETEHFRLTFDAGTETIARRAAELFEAAHRDLVPVFSWRPRMRTQVLLIDNTDAANGSATAVARYGVVLYLTPPEAWTSIGHYDDWLRLLVYHEYTHFLNIDTTRGLYTPLRALFGDTILPNAAWPLWMLEGLATWVETRHTRAGRGRAPYWEMQLRAAVEAEALGAPSFVPLDRVNDRNPYFPGGETHYLYGYQLMNQVARGREDAAAGERSLGELSFSSARRVPWFINGNLENVTGLDWYGHWDRFLADTRSRLKRDLEKIRTAPLTPIERYVDEEYGALGPAVSPDGTRLAYTRISIDRRTGLYEYDLDSRRARRLDDKALGVGLAYTPDASHLLYSRVARRHTFYTWTDLYAWDFRRNRAYRLTHGLRARDPDVSRDGRWVVFTVGRPGHTALVRAPLARDEAGRLSVGPPEELFSEGGLSRVSNPRLSPDGARVAFSLHRNDGARERVMVLDLATRRAAPALADDARADWNREGQFQRFPAWSPEGELHLVAHLNGVDNVYRVTPGGRPEAVTNLTTGAWLPAFGPDGRLYASVFGLRGWALARLSASPVTTAPEKLAVEPPPAPAPATAVPTRAGEEFVAGGAPAISETEDYSPLPSLWPRQWAPLAYTTGTETFYGAQLFGYDALDLHSYLLLGQWNATLGKPAGSFRYDNRQLGVVLSFAGSEISTLDLLSGERPYDGTGYWRERQINVSASFPFRFTFSSLVPFVRLGLREVLEVAPGGIERRLSPERPYVPELDAGVTWTDIEDSRLAVSAERGRRVSLASRAYRLDPANAFKGLLQYQEFVPVAGHTILVPNVKAAYTNHVSGHRPARVLLQGRETDALGLGLPAPTDLEELGIRGYRGYEFSARGAAVPAVDLRFPLIRGFRGWGTNPVFFEQIWGEAFAECAVLSDNPRGFRTLPSAGAGLRFDLTLFHQIPVRIGVDYQHGFRNVFERPKDDLFVTLGVSGFAF